MKELAPRILLAVFQEMLGAMLWPLVAVVVLGTLAFLLLMLRERGLRSRRLVRAQLLGLPGGALALWIMASVSSSGFTDAGGPADWLLIALVFTLGAFGAIIVGYTLAGWLSGGSRPHPLAKT